MECLIRGCNFLLRNISNEVFEFHREQDPPYVFQSLNHSERFPYLLVNIGSGVSIVKVISQKMLKVEIEFRLKVFNPSRFLISFVP